MKPRLNVNIDHVATVRQARRAPEPSVVAAAVVCEQAGADGITVHFAVIEDIFRTSICKCCVGQLPLI